MKVCHQLSAKMYVTGYGGNLAWRLEDEVILITPTMLNKGEIQAEDLVFINPEGETIEGKRRPTGEKYMYLKFFSERPDIKSVIHCHSPNVCAFAIMEGDYLMKPYFPETTHEVGPVPVVPYAEPISQKLADNFSDYLPDGELWSGFHESPGDRMDAHERGIAGIDGILTDPGSGNGSKDQDPVERRGAEPG